MPREPKEPKEEGLENFQPPDNFVSPVSQQPQIEDPYAMMKQRDELVFNALQDINNRLTNLQETWDRILNVAKEPPMRQQYYRPLYQQPQPPIYQQPPVYYPPDSSVPGLPSVDNRPKWDREIKEEPKKATKLKPNKLILVAIVMIVLIIVAMFLKGQGWSCIMGG